ncbi:Glutaredoxin-C4 [Seminavis robusta]|uniref:Glutaredoxin-C4 n=1 Tax=Seminavis robusta TaxID=568900 RepID=A0A9N8DXP8_9STRA|nr:Glutaredoxin-C4 [Seminavis robusta]|eukprot:Sro324_g117540.1 Glutaredoxin-C4 (985) ;mRNA; f:31569-34624
MVASGVQVSTNNDVDVDDYTSTELVEEDFATPEQVSFATNTIVEVTDLSNYKGSSVGDRVESFLHEHSVAVIAKSHCPFCRDVLDVLAKQLGVTVHVINVDKISGGGNIHKHIINTYKHRTVPAVFVRGQFLGGCDDVKALRANGKLERELLAGLIGNQRATYSSGKVETAHLVPVQRSKACHPLFWFPNVVNNYVVRVTGFFVCLFAVLSAAFPNEDFPGYVAAGLLIDFVLRMVVGSSASPLGMVATFLTSPFHPQFKPGPPKQFAAACGTFFSLMGTIFYFVEFEYHQYIACGFMAGLAMASGLEWAFDFCLGCLFYSWGIMFGIFPDYVYRIYTSSKQEVEESWEYMHYNSNAPKPEKVDSDPSSAISLKYKRKTDEWTKDDFNIIRNMQVSYFAMPLALLALAVAFKMGAEFTTSFNTTGVERQYVITDEVYMAVGLLGTVILLLWALLYLARFVLHSHKCKTEWDCPMRSPSFGAPTICLMLISFLIHDEEVEDYRLDDIARVIFWVGSLAHCLLTIAKLGEWVGMRHELEHVHSQWMILPVGLSVAALVCPMIPLFDLDNDNARGNVLVARLFQSFAVVMWIVLFVINFLKVVTSHNSDNRLRHGVFIWVAAPCIIGMADYSICVSDKVLPLEQCNASFVNYFFMALFIFAVLCWSTLPYIGFLGKDKFGMQYWIGCFALGALAACSALMYAIYGYNALENLMITALIMASVANGVCFLHTLASLSRRRGVFTPEQKWGPLSFMKLTHEAIRGNMETMRSSLDTLDLNDKSDAARDHLAVFAAHFNRLCIVHDEHSKHEDQVIFKEFNDWFSKHAKKYNDDHEDFHAKIAYFKNLANLLLNTNIAKERRQSALDTLKKDLPPFLDYFLVHLKGEEDNLNPIGRKYLPLQVQKQISRKVFQITASENWEVIIPYVINNLPRHVQRVRYLKVLLWSMPERGQQIGAIVYRNVDAVMWERLRVEVPEMIPRGAYNWRRYY